MSQLFNRELPEGAVGESWELGELAEHENVVAEGPKKGEKLGDLWPFSLPTYQGEYL